ncbi:hypothetical protein [Kibdelosporangium aridum]|uniref:hypothetical protein n=1 Tax=Kibdelosporangium aridum TaxID=2030 RepID=UPI000A7C53D8|nr:hypothetical protein [Kibdelosporangium aridum]
MRRRLSWAAVGTSGVLAAIVATTMSNQSGSEPQRGKIIVPQAEELNGYIPSTDEKPPTVFIPVVPPVAATSATSTVPPPPPPPPRKQTPAPKPKKPAPPPPTTVAPPPAQRPSYQDRYWSYWYYHYYNSHRDRYGYYDGRRR